MLGMFRYDATSVLPGIGVPTLVIVGDRDESCAPAGGRTHGARTIPGARLLRLPEARHCGLYEFHGEFAAAVEEFVAACARPFGVPDIPVARTERPSFSNPG